jgi:monofunctional biosynthetic peptidoglycan transglycosylase
MTKTKSKTKKPSSVPDRSTRQKIKRVLIIAGGGCVAVLLCAVIALRFVPVWKTPYMWAQQREFDALDYEWVSVDQISPEVLYAVVAAEDANFCLHWGFDMTAIRGAIAAGGKRGASTISQQVVKNTFLWHGRSWPRKALEAILTPIIELVWNKRRILEVYVNVAEFDQGVFGIEAAAQNYFGIGADAVSSDEAALLAAVLPDPKGRSAANPSKSVRKRAMDIMDGAVLIQKDQRTSCFMD